MAQIDVYPAAAGIDFEFQEKDAPEDVPLGSEQSAGPEVAIAGLPPLLRGHPDVHLRAGIIAAFSNEEANSERAFFAADLSQVYAQHERWRANLPDIEPFFGEWCGVCVCVC